MAAGILCAIQGWGPVDAQREAVRLALTDEAVHEIDRDEPLGDVPMFGASLLQHAAAPSAYVGEPCARGCGRRAEICDLCLPCEQAEYEACRAAGVERWTEAALALPLAPPAPPSIDEAIHALFTTVRSGLGLSMPGVLKSFPESMHADVRDAIEQAKADVPDRVDWYKSDDDPPVEVYHAFRLRPVVKPAASPVDTSTPRFYVLSLKHRRDASDGLLWWGPDAWDYFTALSRAGQFTDREIAAAPNRFNNGVTTFAIERSVVDALVEDGVVNARHLATLCAARCTIGGGA